MWSDAEAAATELDLRELLAAKPPHLRGDPGAGRRSPGGERLGRGHAPGLDFDGLGDYRPGDDVRHIDWKASARAGGTKVRRFRATAHRARMIVPDLGLRFGTVSRLAAKTAALTAARLAWEAQMLGEPVGVALDLPAEAPRRGRRHVIGLLDSLRRAYAPQAPKPPLDVLVLAAAERLGAGDELFIIGDLAEEAPQLAPALAALAERFSLRAILVEDPIQLRPVPPGVYPVRIAERRDVFRIGRRGAAEAANAAAEERRRRIEILRDAGCRVDAAEDVRLGARLA